MAASSVSLVLVFVLQTVIMCLNPDGLTLLI